MVGYHSFPSDAIVLYDGPRFQVSGKDYGSDTVVLTFAERKEPKPADFFGLGFCDKERISWIAVRSLENDWYLGPEMDFVFSAIRSGLEKIEHQRLIMFGYSMGSFGVVRSANIFFPDRIILGGPVVTLNPNLERRWLSDYRELLPMYDDCKDYIIPWTKNFEVVVIFDPKSEDTVHVDILERTNQVKRLEVVGAGHLVLTYLSNSGVLGSVMRMLLQPDIDLPSASSLIRAARKKNKSYLLMLSERLAKRPELKRRVLRYAMNGFPGDNEVLLAHASVLAASQEFEASAKIINDLVAAQVGSCFGVPLGKAIFAFAHAGGKASAISSAVQIFSSDRARSREVQLWYSRFLRQTKSFDAAFAAHEMFMTGDTFEAHAHIERGLILEQFGLCYGARDSFMTACRLAPNFGPAKQHLLRIQRLMAQPA